MCFRRIVANGNPGSIDVVFAEQKHVCLTTAGMMSGTEYFAPRSVQILGDGLVVARTNEVHDSATSRMPLRQQRGGGKRPADWPGCYACASQASSSCRSRGCVPKSWHGRADDRA